MRYLIDISGCEELNPLAELFPEKFIVKDGEYDLQFDVVMEELDKKIQDKIEKYVGEKHPYSNMDAPIGFDLCEMPIGVTMEVIED